MNLASPLERSKHTNTSYLKKKKTPHFYLLVLDQRFLRKIKYRKIIIMHFFYNKSRATCCFGWICLNYTSRLSRVIRMYTELKSLQPAVWPIFHIMIILLLPDRSSVSSDHSSFCRLGKGREVQIPLSATCRIKRFWASKNQSNIFV